MVTEWRHRATYNRRIQKKEDCQITCGCWYQQTHPKQGKPARVGHPSFLIQIFSKTICHIFALS